MKRIGALIDWLVHGGSFRLRPYELLLLERGAVELGKVEGARLRDQLSNIARIKRLLGDRQVNFYFAVPASRLVPLADVGEARCRVKLILKTPAGRLHAAVVTHRGILSSLEFSKRPTALRHGPYEVVATALDGAHRSPAEVADRLEHGKS